MKNLLLLLFLFVTGSANATTWYACDCQSTAYSTCTANNAAASDSNTNLQAQNPATPKRTTAPMWTIFNGVAAPGDSVLFGRGCGWTNAGGLLQNTAGVASNPITIGAYTPTWCDAACLAANPDPVLVDTRLFGTPNLAILEFNNGGGAVSDGGYVVDGLDIRGSGITSGTTMWGIFLSGGVHDVTMQNMKITGTKIGIHCGLDNNTFQVLNSVLTNNSEQGSLFSCNYSLIEGNTFINNGYASGDDKDHQLYIGTENGNVGLTVRGNIFLQSSETGGYCRSPVLVHHGVSTGLVIEDNFIYQAPSTSVVSCYGIAADTGYATDESFTSIVIRGNVIVNAGSTSIGCTSCINPLIENNIIVNEVTMFANYPIAVPDGNRNSGGDAANTGAVIRNNSIYIAAGPTDTYAIDIGEYGIAAAGTSMVIANNLIYFGAAVNSAHACFNIGNRTSSNFITGGFDNNLCYHAGGTGSWSGGLGTFYSNLAAAQAAGFDTHGSAANPNLVATPTTPNWSMAVQAGSPAINNATLISQARLAFQGYKAIANRDIGAYEFGSNP